MDVETVLHEAWTRARARWPEIELARDQFVAHAHTHVGELGPETAAKLHLEDLYLACACLQGGPAAIRHFERDVLAGSAAAVRGLDSSDVFVDEVLQRLRAKLLVAGTGSPPRIAEFAGRGALVSWVTVAAVRTGLSLLRETKREHKYADDGWAEALSLPDTGDVEVELFKQRYRDAFARGLIEACAALPPRDRTIMRMHFMDGLNIDQIGVIYGVHRATVARWIARSRGALLESTKQWLSEHLAVPTSEFSSVDRMVRSQLDVSFGTLFPEDLVTDEGE